MKKGVIVVAMLACLAGPAWAKNFAFPEKNPAGTVTIPDKWTTEEIAYGYSAKSPDGDVFFSVESTGAKSLEKMMAANTAWMKENKIEATGAAVERELNLGGLAGKLVSYPAKDENGPTVVDFVFIAAPNDRIIFLTLWASEEERAANAADIKTIQGSLKAIN